MDIDKIYQPRFRKGDRVEMTLLGKARVPRSANIIETVLRVTNDGRPVLSDGSWHPEYWQKIPDELPVATTG